MGVKKLLTFFLSSALRRKEERDGKETASSESKEEQGKIDSRKITERMKKKAGVGRRKSERVSTCQEIRGID